MKPSQPNQSLANGLACLQMLAGMDRPVGSRQLGRLLNIEHTKANRLLGTLRSLGLAEQTPDRKYIPGPAIHVLAAQAIKGSGLLASSLAHVGELENEKLTIALGVLWQGRVCYVLYAPAGTPVVNGLGHHILYPAGRSSIGRSILADAARSEIDHALAVLAQEGAPVRRRDFMAGLKQVQTDGYAVRPHNDSPDMISTIGVPIGTPPLAGLAFAGDIPLQAIPRLYGRLRAVAGRIAGDLGRKSG